MRLLVNLRYVQCCTCSGLADESLCQHLVERGACAVFYDVGPDHATDHSSEKNLALRHRE